MIKIAAESGEVIVSHVVTCDARGFVVARSSADCSSAATSFDVRRVDLWVHKALVTTDFGIVAAIVAALVVVSIIVAAET